jgi:hypothetical protein
MPVGARRGWRTSRAIPLLPFCAFTASYRVKLNFYLLAWLPVIVLTWNKVITDFIKKKTTAHSLHDYDQTKHVKLDKITFRLKTLNLELTVGLHIYWTYSLNDEFYFKKDAWIFLWTSCLSETNKHGTNVCVLQNKLTRYKNNLSQLPVKHLKWPDHTNKNIYENKYNCQSGRTIKSN